MRRQTYWRFGIVATWMVTLAGCGAAPDMAYARGGTTQAAVADRGPVAQAPAAAAPPPTQPASGSAPAGAGPSVHLVGANGAPSASATPSKEAPKHASNPSVLILYVGSLSMSIDEAEVPASMDKMVDAAEAVGGHLGGRTDTSITLKVPSASFRATLTEIEKLGAVTSRSVTAEDVTEEYKDAEVRLANLKATRARLQEFLARAANISDMLTIEQQLERVALDIDRIEGRMRFLRERTAFSTITVQVTVKPRPVLVKAAPPPPPPPPPPPAPIVAIDLPAKWLEQLGSERLLQVKK